MTTATIHVSVHCSKSLSPSLTENYFALHEHILPAVAENEMFLVSLHNTLDDANETKQCRATSKYKRIVH